MRKDGLKVRLQHQLREILFSLSLDTEKITACGLGQVYDLLSISSLCHGIVERLGMWMCLDDVASHWRAGQPQACARLVAGESNVHLTVLLARNSDTDVKCVARAIPFSASKIDDYWAT